MENEVKQEPIYLDYGSNKIDQNQFFTRAADNVNNWVNSQSWSRKRKEKFLNAYSDLMSKGITGASNTSGQWELNLNQELNLDSMSKKDQEMYHEAAYYILQQMSGITPKESEEKKKEEEKRIYLYLIINILHDNFKVILETNVTEVEIILLMNGTILIKQTQLQE